MPHTELVLVVVRFYRGDSRAHRYYCTDLDGLDRRGAVTPVCQLGRFYPLRHDPELIGDCDLPEAACIDGCPDCATWARRNRYTSLLRGVIPRPRSSQTLVGASAPRLAPAGTHRAIR